MRLDTEQKLIRFNVAIGKDLRRSHILDQPKNLGSNIMTSLQMWWQGGRYNRLFVLV